MISLDEDLRVFESLDIVPGCTVLDGCDANAEWFWKKPCCVEDYLLCTPHKESVKKFMIDSKILTCWTCNSKFSVEDPDALKFVKL